MKKNILKRMGAAVLAVTMMTVLLAGCGKNRDSTSGTNAPSETSENGNGETNDDIVKLRVWGFGYTATSDDTAAVSAAISEITKKEIGVEVELVRSSDAEKLNLALMSDEQLDLVNFHTYSGGLSTLVSTGMAMPIEDLVNEYGQDMIATLGEDNLKLGKVDGELYSVPSMQQVISTGYGIAMREDILKEMNISPDSIKTWDDVHDVLVKVKAAYPDMYPVVPSWGGGGQQKTFAFDNLGTGFWDGLGILENAHDSSTTVVNMYETDSYREFVDRMYQWNKEGLLMPDAVTSNEVNLCGSVGFSMFENNGATKEAELEDQWGKDAVVIELVPPFVASDKGGSSFFIPSSCEYPEKAMQLWNLMYTNAEIDNLLCNGVEGIHYEYTDEGKIKQIEGSTYDLYSWAWPNGELAPVLDGVDADQWKKVTEYDKAASKSPALGFKFDNSNVMNEITACNNVIVKYDTALRWGQLDPNEILPKFNEELKAAGLDTIIAEKQSQLDEFLGK